MNSRFFFLLLLLAGGLLTGCGRQDLEYGFSISNVSVSQGYQSLNISIDQDLVLSRQAREALHHGVTLIMRLDLELQNEHGKAVMEREARQYAIRYLPLSERYQFIVEESGNMQTFPRLRHVLTAAGKLGVKLATGTLPAGNYELRARVLLDESRLPTPMQLPAWFSSQWQHDSEWSVWPVKVGV